MAVEPGGGDGAREGGGAGSFWGEAADEEARVYGVLIVVLCPCFAIGKAAESFWAGAMGWLFGSNFLGHLLSGIMGRAPVWEVQISGCPFRRGGYR